VTRAIADTSVFVAQELGRELGELPEQVAVSVITVAELELGVLRARDTQTRARRLATLARVRGAYALLAIDPQTASCFARLAAGELEAGRKIRNHDTWIAACAMRHGVAVITQDEDFTSYSAIRVIRV
jgi:hypothetical protein